MASEAVRWLIRHHSTLPDQIIGQTASRKQMEELLREPAPEQGQPFEAVLAEFQDKIEANAFKTNHPRFLAFIPSAPNFLSVLGELLTAGTNFFCGVWLEAAGPSQVELIVLDWFRDLLELPAGTRGLLTSGGSEANLTALVVARESLKNIDRPRAILYVTEQRHWSVDRAAKIIGFMPDQIRPVAAGDDFRMLRGALHDAIHRDRSAGRIPWAAVANAGATNTGAVDPLAELADLCRHERIWLHVDAAYGWSAVMTPEGKIALNGIGACDSVTLDPHKWFGQSFESGCLLVREGKRLAETFAMRPEYMQDVEPETDQINFADHGLALTRRFRALKLWLSIKVLGLNWYRDLVGRSCRLAELAQALLEQHPEFEILCPRHLSIVCFRYRSPHLPVSNKESNCLNLAIIEELRATGRAFISSTRLRGQVALRFCFVNWRTTTADIEEVIRLLMEIGMRLSSERGV
ncbi:MAG TPA: pyridoxal-dependent decarboxylase, partial [Gemmataceae bacterium]|nr:pyridoxal-dependent decarboxylase [Gemmataceae bacterium]